MDKYVEQHKHFGLGNFINLTPAIRHLSKESGSPVSVYFQSDYVRECYIDSPYIKIIDSPSGECIMTSGLICKTNAMPDYMYVQQQVFGIDTGCESFIDKPETTIEGKYGIIVNGSGNDSPGYVGLKHIGADIWNEVIKMSDIPVYLVGSVEDANRNKSVKCEKMVGNIRNALGAINGAEWVIANDTGLAHAAGVMDKKLLTLFKHTLFPKNKNTGRKSVYSFKGNHIIDINTFLHDLG
jgi:hypothetical protein